MKLRPLEDLKVPSKQRAASDPAAYELRKKYAREKLRESKARSPQKYKESARRSHESLMADPARLARKRAYAKARARRIREADPLRPKADTIKHRYGITLADYEVLLVNQLGVCAICRLPESVLSYKTKQPYKLAVDHCHATGKIRGLLCQRCNKGLGLLKDSVRRVLRASRYLSGVAQK